MKSIATLIIGAGILALQGCAADPDIGVDTEEDIATNESAVSVGSANIQINSDWGSGYCANVTLSNGLGESTSRWKLLLDLKTTTISSSWNATFSAKTGSVSVTPVNYNSMINPGGSTSFGFCASAPSSSVRPIIKAWNMESAVYATCPANSGLNPTKASLAVAMANELGRWDPLNDLAFSGNKTVLSSTGLSRCKNDCKNVKMLLGQQDDGLLSFVDQSVFVPNVFRSDLQAAIGRQRDLIANLTMNNRSALPPEHKLTFVGGPVNLGKGNCGPHYIFQVDKIDGSPLSYTEATNMKNTLCYFGQGSCGGNPYLAFTTVSDGCPSGRTCVAIDPTDGDNSSTSTTTAGSAPTYPMNRVYDPSNTLLGTQCITTKGTLGTLVSKCDTYPFTCGTLYCIPN